MFASLPASAAPTVNNEPIPERGREERKFLTCVAKCINHGFTHTDARTFMFWSVEIVSHMVVVAKVAPCDERSSSTVWQLICSFLFTAAK